MLEELEENESYTTTKMVKWEFPPEGWIKYNTDGASRGNPGLNAYAFSLRDEKGDIIMRKVLLLKFQLAQWQKQMQYWWLASIVKIIRRIK